MNSNTPRREQAEETRRKLLDSARRLFSEKGFAGTSVRSINRAIGMADGILYHYFPGGKKEILQVLIKDGLEAGAKQMDSQVVDFEKLSLKEALTLIYQTGDKVMGESYDLLRIIVFEADIAGGEPIEAISSFLVERHKMIVEFLKAKHRAGEIRKMDFDAVAEMLMAARVSILIENITCIKPGVLEQEHRIDRLIDHIVDTLKA